MEPPAWSVQLHVLLHRFEAEVDRGDMREISEVGGDFWKVVWKQGFLATEGEPQSQ